MPEEEVVAVDETTEPTTDDRPPENVLREAQRKQAQSEKAREKAEKDSDALKKRLEKLESANLSELEKAQRRAEDAERDRDEARKAAEQSQEQVSRAKRERLIVDAAGRANFDDPSDALRFADIVDLDQIESQADAERAVKALAKQKPKLLKDDTDRKLPGRVMKDGKATEAKPGGGIDTESEAQVIYDGLKKFQDQWHTVGQ